MMIMDYLKNYSRLAVLAAVALLPAGCSQDNSQELKDKEQRALMEYLDANNITTEPTESGLYYIPEVTGTGLQPEPGDYIEIEYTGELIDGTVFASTDDSTAKEEGIYAQGILYGPVRFLIDNTLKGLNEGISMMKGGGKATLICPSDIALGSTSSSIIPSYSTLIYHIRLDNVIRDPDSWEQNLIQAWLDSNDIDQTASNDSIYYISEEPGVGNTIETGDLVSVYYKAYLLDGRVFDSNLDDANPFQIGFPSMGSIDGWNEGLKKMRKNSKGTLLIPYKKGYGSDGAVDAYGRTIVGPYMTILFDIEITDVQ